MKILAFIFSIFYCILTFSQTDPYINNLPNITLPSPTAYELGRYGQVPVGEFTGTPNISIPIYNYKSGSITVPISLSYNSNGIKVDQMPSNVGLGWSLNAGGVITRIVRGLDDLSNGQYFSYFPDEEITTSNIIENTSILDFLYKKTQTGNEFKLDSEMDLYMYNFMGYQGQFIHGQDGRILLMPNKNLQVFTYSNDGAYGYEIIIPNGIKYIFTEQEITEKYFTGQGVGPEPPVNNKFITSWYLSKIVSPNGESVSLEYHQNTSYEYQANISQQLFHMDEDVRQGCPGPGNKPPLNEVKPELTTHLRIKGKSIKSINSNNVKSGKVQFGYLANNNRFVNSIKITNEYSDVIENVDLSYDITSNHRIFLNNIKFLTPKKQYNFSYHNPESLPTRLSKSQDHWGFFNNKPNNSYLPKLPNDHYFLQKLGSYYYQGADKSIDSTYNKTGILTEIKYPTGGNTKFEYESNTIWSYISEGIPHVKNLRVNEKKSEDTYSTNKMQYSTNVEINTYIGFNTQVSGCTDPIVSKIDFPDDDGDGSNDDGGDNLPHRLTADIYVLENGNVIYSKALRGHTPRSKFNIKFSEGSYYQVKLKRYDNDSFDRCVEASATISYNENPIPIYDNVLTGGLRLKSVTSVSKSNSEKEYTRYYYAKKESLDESSADKENPISYISTNTVQLGCNYDIAPPCDSGDFKFTILNSTPTNSYYPTLNNNTTVYKHVTVSHGGDNFENGGEEKEFFIGYDGQYQLVYGEPFFPIPRVNTSWNTGLLSSHLIFRKGDEGAVIPLNKIDYNYFKDDRGSNVVYNYIVRRRYTPRCSGSLYYTCKQEDLTKEYEYYECTADHNHVWAALPFDKKSWDCINKGNNDNTPKYKNHVCNDGDGPNTVGTRILYSSNFKYIDIGKYATYSHWFYMDSKIETVYDEHGNNPVITKTQYKYDNPLHLQPTEVIVNTINNNKTVKTKTYYPDDVTTASALGTPVLSNTEYNAIHKLKVPTANNKNALHQIAQPVQTVTTVTNNGISTKQTQRISFLQKNNMVLPEFLKTLKGNYSITNPLQTRIIYHNYDNKGNPLEISKPNGSLTVYIWGYNKTYPIAKIENIRSYDQVSIYVEAIQAKSDADNDRTIDDVFESGYRSYHGKEGALRRELNKLRTNLKQAMVTTYTYDPLIGLTSVTDPKGDSIYYCYDDFNRLQYVKDQYGNIVKENKYNYATN